MVRHLVQAHHVRRDDLADRPRINLTVGVATHPGIHRAVVHARTAADTVQRLAQLGIGESTAAAIVQQHQMHFLRTIQLIRLARAGNHVHVGGDGLAQCRTGQQDNRGTTSRRFSTTFSMPVTAMCTGGAVVLMRPLPSFSTSSRVPVSAMAKLTPDTPTSASRNFCRRVRRPIWISSFTSSVSSTPSLSWNSLDT